MAMSSPNHPDSETLERFVLGRLDRRLMAKVESHLETCSRCVQTAVLVGDDRLVTLLRTPDASPAAECSSQKAAGSP
jgi:anti-sigma factor RsiW